MEGEEQLISLVNKADYQKILETRKPLFGVLCIFWQFTSHIQYTV